MNIISVRNWLLSVTMMVLIMVTIGGLTRLTNSGLSIVEWKPITGIIPPISESDWQEEFSKYKNSPEFIKLNNKMDVAGFKKIYWLEYIHRILARVTGLVFFIPLLYFMFFSCLDRRIIKTLFFVSILGICQGFMGWYMVKSGLIDLPYVNHFKLTFHLLFAVFIYLLVFNEVLRLHLKGLYLSNLSYLWRLIISVTIIQISLGGLTAGLDAGTIYNEFPLMGKSFIPDELFSASFAEYLIDPAIVQFLHRITAYFLFALIFYASLKLLIFRLYSYAIALIIAISIQVLLGITTLLLHVPILFASLHQIFAFILLAVMLTIGRIIRI